MKSSSILKNAEAVMEEKAKIILDGKEYEFPVIEGTENEKAIDITALRSETSYITLDNGFGNDSIFISNCSFITSY